MVVQFDTGSSDLAVASVGSFDTVTGSPFGTAEYKHNESWTYEHDGESAELTYGDGSTIDGFISIDDVLLDRDIKVTGQSFVEIQRESGMSVDGIFGLAFMSLSAIDRRTVFDNAIAQSVIDQQVFAFYLGENEAELTWGGYDSTRFEGELVYVPLYSATYWEIALDGVYSGYYRSCGYCNHTKGNMTAIIDSGTTLLLGPSADVALLAWQAGAIYNSTFGTYTIACAQASSVPDIVFGIQGVDYIIPGNSTVVSYGDPSECLFAVEDSG